MHPRRSCAVLGLAVLVMLTACSQRAAPSANPAVTTCQDAQKLVDLHIARGSVPYARNQNPNAADSAQYDQLTALINSAAATLEAVAATDTDANLRDMARVVAIEDLQGQRAQVLANWSTDVGALPAKCAAVGYNLENFDLLDLAG